MSGYNSTNHQQDPVYLVRTIGRLSQMLLEIRDEYIRDPRPDTLDQFERRLDEIAALREELRELRGDESADEPAVPETLD